MNPATHAEAGLPGRFSLILRMSAKCRQNVTREEGNLPMDLESDVHPTDGALGDIQEIALILAAQGQHEMAGRLAEAGESIERYLLRTESEQVS